jgi:hypothetical protein
MSALRASRLLLPGRLLVLVSVSGSVGPRAIVRLKELGQRKNSRILQIKKINALFGTRNRELAVLRKCVLVVSRTIRNNFAESLYA